MILTQHPDARAFLGQAQGWLEQREAAHNLILGLASRLAAATKPPTRPVYLATVANAAGLSLAAALTPPFSLALAGSADPATLDVLIAGMPAGSWQLPGVVGEPALAAAFAQRWAAATGVAFEVSMNQRIYQLSAVRHPAYPPGELRPAASGEAELVADWLHAFEAEALSPGSREQALAMAHQKIRNQDIYFWAIDGRPVTMAGRARPTRHGICINAVYTPPELRRRGYASVCVAALSQQLLDASYRFCMLYTDRANPTSNAIYQAIGYAPVADSTMYRFGA